MTYIRCPECGQKALSVATQCPKCGYVLSQNPMQSGGERGLIACRECQKMIPRGVAECPYCGYTGRSPIWQVLAVALVIVLVTGAGYGVWRLVSGGVASDGEPTPERPAVPEMTDPVDTGRSVPDTGAGQPTAPSLPGDSAATAASAERPGPDSAAAAPTPRPTPLGGPGVALLVRWTDNWVNLREGPGIGYGVVRILEPGVRIEVSGPERGWWPVWETGEMVGYVAGSELTAEQPDTSG